LEKDALYLCEEMIFVWHCFCQTMLAKDGDSVA